MDSQDQEHRQGYDHQLLTLRHLDESVALTHPISEVNASASENVG
jgi:hypothetical protein